MKRWTRRPYRDLYGEIDPEKWLVLRNGVPIGNVRYDIWGGRLWRWTLYTDPEERGQQKDLQAALVEMREAIGLRPVLHDRV